MEVLKHGKNYTTVNCPRCEATIGYSGSDIIAYNSTEEIFETTFIINKAFFRCPECGEVIIIQDEVKELNKEEA